MMDNLLFCRDSSENCPLCDYDKVSFISKDDGWKIKDGRIKVGKKAAAFDSLFSNLSQEKEPDLRAKIDVLQLTLLRVKCETEGEMRRLAREIEEKNEVLRQLRRQLEEQSDYKELQHQARYTR